MGGVENITGATETDELDDNDFIGLETLFLEDNVDHPNIIQPLSPKSENYNGDYDSDDNLTCLLYTSPSPRDRTRSRMPSSA